MNGVWIEGMRISTVATFVVFGLTGLVRGGDMRALWSAAAWIGGFEAAYQITGLVIGTARYPAILVLGAFIFLAAWRRSATPSLLFIGLTAVVWVVWMAFGFHANESNDPQGFSVLNEVLNESAKSLFALAFLVPLWRSDRRAASRAAAGAAFTAGTHSSSG